MFLSHGTHTRKQQDRNLNEIVQNFGFVKQIYNINNNQDLIEYRQKISLTIESYIIYQNKRSKSLS